MTQSVTGRSGSGRLIGGLMLLLILIIFYLIARIFMTLHTPQLAWQDTDQSALMSSPNKVPSSAKAYDFSFDPFFRETGERLIQPDVEDAPETSLNLKLTGLRAGDDPNVGGSAVMRTPDNREATYYIEDEIISDVTLKAVYPNYIILSQNGQRERLTFERDDENGLLSSQSATGNRGVRSNANFGPRSGSGLGSASLQEFMEKANLSIVREGRSVKGYRVTPKGNVSNLSQFGLQSGDIITQVGSRNLTVGSSNISAILSELRRGKPITVLRNGQKVTVEVNLK